ncbi:MAG: ABC transporter substrate-binding protein, partial [Pseudorhodoplanes sp.]
MQVTKRMLWLWTGVMLAGLPTGAYAQQAPIKIGVPVFLSGPAVGAFGEPSKNAATLVIKAMNAGELPAPYNQKGLAGVPIDMKIVDEAGSTATAVTEFKNLVQRDKVDVVVGYVSSASCTAIAPVAEELEVLTV